MTRRCSAFCDCLFRAVIVLAFQSGMNALYSRSSAQSTKGVNSVLKYTRYCPSSSKHSKPNLIGWCVCVCVRGFKVNCDSVFSSRWQDRRHAWRRVHIWRSTPQQINFFTCKWMVAGMRWEKLLHMVKFLHVLSYLCVIRNRNVNRIMLVSVYLALAFGGGGHMGTSLIICIYREREPWDDTFILASAGKVLVSNKRF